MPAITIPGTSIKYGWQEREKGWGPGMNTNLLVLGVIAKGRVLSRATTTPPSDPDEGDAYIIPAGATGAWSGRENDIAAFFSDAWVYIEPVGTPMYVIDEAARVYYDGSEWSASELPQYDFVNQSTAAGDFASLADGDKLLGVDVSDSNTAKNLTLSQLAASQSFATSHVKRVTDLTALRALTGMQANQTVEMVTTGRAGLFRWDSSDLSAEVTADTQMGIYVPPTGQDGSSGAWVRVRSGPDVYFEWWGAAADGVTDDTAAVKGAIAYANTQRVQPLFGNDVVLKGQGVILISEQIDLTRCHIDLQGGRFKLAANFPASPAIYAQTGAGNAWASRVFRIAVDGDRDNQAVSPLVAVHFEDFNWLNSDIRIGLYQCDDGVKVTGNTENQRFIITGSKVNRVVVESQDAGGSTPDENVYFISTNNVKQIFEQDTAAQETSCILHLNCEATEVGATDYPVVIRSNKMVHLFGEMRAMSQSGGVHIDGGSGLHCYLGGLTIYASDNAEAFKVTDCGSLNGSLILQSADGGAAILKKVRLGGSLDLTVNGCDTTAALELGDDADDTQVVEAMSITLNPASTGTQKDLIVRRVADCDVRVKEVVQGVEITTIGVAGLELTLPRSLIINDVPVTEVATAQNFRGAITIEGNFSDAQLQAYSTPLIGMRATNNRGNTGLMAYYTGAGATGGWQIPTMADL